MRHAHLEAVKAAEVPRGKASPERPGGPPRDAAEVGRGVVAGRAPRRTWRPASESGPLCSYSNPDGCNMTRSEMERQDRERMAYLDTEIRAGRGSKSPHKEAWRDPERTRRKASGTTAFRAGCGGQSVKVKG